MAIENRVMEINDEVAKGLLSDLYFSWGNSLADMAKTKQGKEAENLYQPAFEKLQKGVELGSGHYNLACLYALRGDKAEAIEYLSLGLSKQEISIDFVLKDQDWDDILDDADFQAVINQFR